DVYNRELTPKMRNLKMDAFGHDMVVLHEHEIRKRTGAFSALGKEARERFMDCLNAIMWEVEFTIFAVVIDKQKHVSKYTAPAHPYYMAMQFGLERISRFLGPKCTKGSTTHIVCESRGKREDIDLELAFRRVCDGANFNYEKMPFELVLADK